MDTSTGVAFEATAAFGFIFITINNDIHHLLSYADKTRTNNKTRQLKARLYESAKVDQVIV